MSFKMKGFPLMEGTKKTQDLKGAQNLIKHYDKYKDDPSYQAALDKAMGGKSTYDPEKRLMHTKRDTSAPLTQKKSKNKEQLLNEGFTQADADQMIKDGAVTGVVAGGAAGAKSSKKVDQSKSDWQPAFPGADYSQAELDAMSDAEKIKKNIPLSKKKKKK